MARSRWTRTVLYYSVGYRRARYWTAGVSILDGEQVDEPKKVRVQFQFPVLIPNLFRHRSTIRVYYHASGCPKEHLQLRLKSATPHSSPG